MHLAIIGDIHGFWDERDTAFFNTSDYDALLFVGDLPRLTGGLDVARELARLTKPAWLIPGNHDGCTALQLLAEIKNWRSLRRVTSRGMEQRVAKLTAALGPVRLAGFEHFELADDLGLIVARPHAMGADRFYYRDYMTRAFGIDSFEDSADKLKALVDAAPKRLIFLAHNGPAGLGDSPQSIWGCDFAPEHGDFGDPDLRAAIDHASATGHHVVAVCAGHMHHRSKSGTTRQTWVREGGTLHINAAAVARIRQGGSRRHHIALRINGDDARAETVYTDATGAVVARDALVD